ncbi:MAG TPA: FAD-dependent oxidoreductase [Bacillota bacterium]|nr:FAD-dependent oxidoreductase [Bacillota bacterium]
MNTIVEERREIAVYDTTDVLVVGGGVAGFAAALAAARSGLSVILVERYGWLGGLATGGMVSVIEPYCNGAGRQIVGGIAYEFAQRLCKSETPGRGYMPSMDEVNSSDPEKIEYWRSWASVGWNDKAVRLNVNIHPEYAKYEFNTMLKEAGVKILLHAWASNVVMDGNTIKGVIFESKSGRMAIMAKVIVDASGDGDVMSWSGSPFVEDKRGAGLVFWVGNVDIENALNNQRENPDEFKKIMKTPHASLYFMRTMVDSVVWFNNWLGQINELDVDELSNAEIEMREKIVSAVDYYRENLPGFKNAQLVKVAPQLGVRLSRILCGKDKVTKETIRGGKEFSDVIGLAGLDTENDISFEIPYGSLIPQNVDNLITAGRFISSDHYAQEYLRLIPCCMVTGEAAGTAAAQSVKTKKVFAQLDVPALQKELKKNGVIL